MSSPTQRTLAVLRKQNNPVCIVEKYNPYARVRIDAFGFGDLLAIVDGTITLVQVTSGSNHVARVTKIRANEYALKWIIAGGQIQVRSWKKRKNRWQERIEIVTI